MPAGRKRRPEPYIYEYRPNGELLGYQVRFKTQRNRQVTSVSQYFSRSRFGGLRAARRAALKWRNLNCRWMDDSTFRPRFERRETGRLRAGASRSAAVTAKGWLR